MEARLLRQDEWPRLTETGLDLSAWMQINPEALKIVVVEHEGRIVATWATMACRHVEGFWVHPDHRDRGGALRRLFIGMRALLKTLGATTVLTQAESPQIEQLLESAGAVPLKGSSYYLPVDFGPWRPKGQTSCHS